MTLNLEDFTVDQDTNGDLVVTYTPTNTVIERIDSGNEEKIFEVGTRVSDLKDATSGATVYDSAAEEVTADVNNSSVSTETGTIGGMPILGGASSSASADISFDTWITVSETQPSLLTLRLITATDGSQRGLIEVDVDESGGTSADYTFFVETPASLGSGENLKESFTLYLPAGSQVQIRNSTDPNSENAIANDRAFILSS